MQRNGVMECSVCHSKVVTPSPRSVSRAYDKHRNKISSKYRALNFLLVSGDCILVGLQPILVFMSKVDGKFQFSPISVNFLTELTKVIFAIVMLIIQSRKQKVGEKPLLSLSTFVQAARNNVLLAVPALLYAINNYLKFIMQLYFNPATVKMLSNLKVLVIAILLKFIMRRKFSIIQWEALALLLIGISVNQLSAIPDGTKSVGLAVTTIAYIYTFIFVTVPSLASVYNEYALKSQFDTSIYLQNLFLYGYGAIFNFLGILGTVVFQDTILKKYSSTVATIFTGLASAAFLGHTLTVNFLLGISIVFISMHQFFSPLAKVKDDKPAGAIELEDAQNHRTSDSFVNMTAGAADDHDE
uniref:CMP-sialic acid transporter n=1 Tax=Leersia perrieri TaxID=77586 RepID=A0A0D9W6K0_9ORYZ